jgi:prepilin-type N-terminal cleavage/methylation domain-containing protein
MNRWAKQKQTGFTIVELLIVIVVIGVLAAITVVAYNGVQQRAQNTQRITAAKDWQKIITGYTSTNGKYPFSGSWHSCLGSGYETNWDANPDLDCAWSNNIKHPSATTDNAFATIAPAPAFPTARLTIGGSAFSGGISLRALETLDPTGAAIANYPTLIYWLSGNNQDCALKPVTVVVTGGIAISDTTKFSYNDGPSTFCRIALPDPGAL